jgi:hypothetical protein
VHFSMYLNPQTRGPDEDVAIVETTIEQAIRAATGGCRRDRLGDRPAARA